MIKAEELNFPKLLGGYASYDHKIIGFYTPNCPIITATDEYSTCILICLKKSEPLNILTLDERIEVVSADVSADKAFLTYTQRINSMNISKIVHIPTCSECLVTTSKSDTRIIFVSSHIQSATFLKLERGSFAYFNAKCMKNSIKIKKNRAGFKQREIYAWQFCKKTNTLSYISEKSNQKAKMYVYRFLEDDLLDDSFIIPSVFLNIVALNGNADDCSNRNVLFTRCGKSNCVVAQIESENRVVVAVYNTMHKNGETFTLPNIDPSKRVCFIEQVSHVLCVIPNSLFMIIDFFFRPVRKVIRINDSLTSCGFSGIIRRLNGSKYFESATKKEIYALKISCNPFEGYRNFLHEKMDEIGYIYSKYFKQIDGIRILHKLTSDLAFLEEASNFYRGFFASFIKTEVESTTFQRSQLNQKDIQYLPMPLTTDIVDILLAFEQNTPSSGPQSRIAQFKLLLEESGCPMTGIPDKRWTDPVLAMMLCHNQATEKILEDFESWKASNQIDKAKIFSIGLILLFESKIHSAPDLPELEDDLEEMAKDLLPDHIRKQIGRNSIIDTYLSSTEQIDEYEYWRSRLPTYLFVENKKSVKKGKISKMSFSNVDSRYV